ncbi:MAG: hypothetical protein JXR97_02950 [Planctomycetes bacterium]|nr:hypothetical protein [Planctomycetota bacterium]
MRLRGAVALEYVLVMALVAMAMIGAFKLWGKAVRNATEESGVAAEGGYDASSGIGGALEAP